MTAKFTQPNYTMQTAAVYKASIDAAIAVLGRLAAGFAAHEQDVGSPAPDLTVRVDAGATWNGITLLEVAAQTVSGFTIPAAGQHRIDRVVRNALTGVCTRVAGTAATGSPSAVAPAIPAGTIPVCQVLINSADSSILNSMITDERPLLATTPPPRGSIGGLGMSNGGGGSPDDLVNDITVAAGEATDDTGAHLMRLDSPLTKQLDGGWAVGTNAGMRDTGAISDGTWHIFEIQRSDTGVVDILASLSLSAPTMPANYDRKRRIGSIMRASGAIRLFTQNGDRFIYNAIALDVNGAACSATAADTGLTVPIGLELIGLLRATLIATGGVGFLITSKDESDQAPAAAGLYSLVCANNGEQAAGHFEILTNASGQVRVRSSTTNGSYSIGTYGWIDYRGRFD